MELPSTLNHYRILGRIGQGGMGAVYAAEDTRLHRKVAVKVLPTLMAADPERRQRFEREAQAIAALNHPNIVTIYSVEEAGGVPFLTMELVEGRPLSEAIPSGGMTSEALLKVGIAVSDAMSAAHQRGITHRDLKPANVMMTADGRVKVLDFGLAKLRDEHAAAPDDVTRMPASPTLTGEGRIIGTVAYMSPEQAEGKAVDQRSDIFSLGVMLHEMGTGDRPFKGDTNVSIISSILKDTPGTITDLNPRLPSGLARIVRRCLAKDPTRRYQSATDLRNDLEEVKQDADSGVTQTVTAAAPARRGRARSPMMPAGILLGVLGLAAAAWFTYGRTRSTAALPAASTGPQFVANRFTRLTTSGNASLAALSPDGRYVVHVKSDGAQSTLWIRQTATSSDAQIAPPTTNQYDGVAFSPDGNYVYYVTYGPTGGGVATLFRIPALGGVASRVVEDIDGAIAFSPDGRRFAFVRGAPATGTSTLVVADADGTHERVLSGGTETVRFKNEAPSWSPDGRTILVAGGMRAGVGDVVCAVDASSGRVTQVGERWAFVRDAQWMPGGGSFLADAVEFGGTVPQIYEVGYPSGDRRHVTNDLNTYVGVSVSADGRSIATVQSSVQSSIWVVKPGEKGEGRRLTSGARSDGAAGLAWLPDGRIVFASDAPGLPQIFIINEDGSGQHQLSNSPGPAVAPVPTPDGRWIFFQAAEREDVSLWRIAPDGSGLQQMTHGGVDTGPVVSRDGRWVYYAKTVAGQGRPYKIPVDGGTPVALGDVNFRPLIERSDGGVFGVAWNQSRRHSEMAVLPAGASALTFFHGLPLFGILSMDDRQYVYPDPPGQPTRLMSRALAGGSPRELLRLPSGQLFNGAVSRDGKLALARGTASTDVILITAR